MAARGRDTLSHQRSSLRDEPSSSRPRRVERWKNIEWLVKGNGDITIGRVGPIDCAATASSEFQCLAMLVRRPRESLGKLLERLDAAIGLALDGETVVDEINA